MYPQERGERWYKFAADADGQYTIMTRGACDTVGYLYSECGSPMASDDDSGDKAHFKIVATVKAGKTYYVKVMHKNSKTAKFEIFAAAGIYPDSVTVEPKELALRVGQTASVTAEISPADITDFEFFTVTNHGWIEITGVADSTGPNPNRVYKTITFQALQEGDSYVRAIAKGRHNSSVFGECAVTIGSAITISLSKSTMLKNDRQAISIDMNPYYTLQSIILFKN